MSQGLGPEGRIATLVRHPLRMRLLQVRGVQRLTPRMVRITLGGPELEGFITLAPDDHVRLLFPGPGQEKPLLPQVGEGGIVWPEGQARPVTRDYTPRRFDPLRLELEIDFSLHGAGVASQWAANARPGQWLGVAGPRGSYVVPDQFDWYLLAGDESALPSLARRLEELPVHRPVLAFLEVEDRAEILPLQASPYATVTWVLRSEGQSLEGALRALKLPSGSYYAWFTGEVGTVRALYRHFLQERSALPGHIKADGYWKRGTANHDHHQQIEA